MRAWWSLSLALVSLPAAAADEWRDDVDDVEFKVTNVELFKGSGYTLWVPDAENELRVKFTVDTSAKLSMTQLGDAILEGEGTALTHTWLEVLNGGHADVLVETDAFIDAVVDLSSFGIPEFSYRAWGDTFEWAGEKDFTSPLLAGGTLNTEVTVDPSQLWNFQFEYVLIDGPTPTEPETLLQVEGYITPDFSTVLSGTEIRTNGVSSQFLDDPTEIDTPNDNDGILPVNADWRGTAASIFGLDITLEIRVIDVDWGTFTSGDMLTYPFGLDQGQISIIADAEDFTHGMPAIEVRGTTLNLGDVVVGEEVTADVTIKDLGKVKLVGTADVEGEGFSLEDDEFVAEMDDPAIIGLTFAPTEEGTFTGEITLATNDPVRPVVTIPIKGEGVLEIDDDTDTDTDPGDDTGDVATGRCGCASGPSTSVGVWGAFALAFLARRRRA